jgi:SAM-dependent methyltransferase
MRREYAQPIGEPPAYEYHGLMAEAWDLLRGDTSDWDDRPFYLRTIREVGEPALDVGCGTGRLLLDYLGKGIDIDGVDVSPEMLALCRAKARALGLTPRLYEQRIEELDLPRHYRTIIVPSSSIQLVLDKDAATRAVVRLAAHLELGGVLVMPFMILAGDHRWVREAIRPDGALVRRTSESRYDPKTQLEETDELYEVIEAGEVVASERHVQSPATRSYTPQQARELCERAGLQIERILQGFTDDPYDGGEIFTIVGRRGLSSAAVVASRE